MKTVEEAARELVYLYRDLFYPDGFIGSARVEEWVNLCEALGEPLERQNIKKQIP